MLGAGTVSTSMSCALAYEGSYAEYCEVKYEPFILEIGSDRIVRSRVSAPMDYMIRENPLNLGAHEGETTHLYVCYTENGADHWLIAVDKETQQPIVYVANKDESKLWELYPNTDPEYK